MNPTRTTAVSILLALTAACGGNGTGTATSAIRAATPTTEAFTVSAGGVPDSPAMGTGVDAMTLFPPVFIGGGDPCHPHLFLRTEAVAARLNRHLYKFLGRIDRLIASHPALETDGQVQWTAVRPSGLEERFTITKVADLHYTWLLEIRADAKWSLL